MTTPDPTATQSVQAPHPKATAQRAFAGLEVDSEQIKTLLFLTTPCGVLGVAERGGAVTDIFFGNKPRAGMRQGNTPLLQQAARELQEYFAAKRHTFSFPRAAEGTPFQQKVWQALQMIPYGQTRSYGQIAVQIGAPKACRAVGMANNRNPLSIVVPCHRVVGSDGKLTGYAGGLATKELLLTLEQK